VSAGFIWRSSAKIWAVSRIVHFLRLHVVGKTITKAVAPDDANIFGKVGTSGPEFVKAVTGKKVCKTTRVYSITRV
jgi:hypothetical protein